MAGGRSGWRSEEEGQGFQIMSKKTVKGADNVTCHLARALSCDRTDKTSVSLSSLLGNNGTFRRNCLDAPG